MTDRRGDRDDVTAEGPVDLAAVRADDAMLDAACRGSALVSGYGRAADDERLADLLAAWRAEVEAEPMPELVSLDEAVAAIRAGHHDLDRPGRGGHRAVPGRPRRRVPWALAVAAAGAVAVLGVGTAVHQATPGDALFGVTQVVFSSHAEAAQRQFDARRDLQEADDAIAVGDLDAARAMLRSADARIGTVDSADQEPLIAQRDRVSASLAPGTSSAVPPSAGSTATSSPVASSATTTTTTSTTTAAPAGAAGVDGASGSAASGGN